MKLTSDEIARYARHLILPEVGREGQERLKASSALIVGAGGLGSPASMYLAAAGVGRIGLVDFDTVDPSNLQRQLLYGVSDVGRPKLEAAAARLDDLNPNVDVICHPEALTAGNAFQVVRDYDVVLDGTDNFPTRYLVNDACVMLGKPNVYGSIYRFEGQCSVFWVGHGPCYRCLYPEPPPPGMVPSCAEGGVLGVLPGLVGTMQATEALKVLLGIGDPLVGRLLLVETLEMRFRELAFQRERSCPVCGDAPTITELIDYDAFCGVGDDLGESPASTAYEITPVEVRRRLDAGDDLVLIDVRNPYELDICAIDGATLVPLPTLPSRLDEFDPEAEIVVICRSGRRSGDAVAYMRSRGFTRPMNMVGGVLRWSDTVDPTMVKY